MSKGGGGNSIGGRLYEDGKSLFVTAVVCTAILCLLFQPAKGVALASKGADVISYAAGAVFKIVTQRVPAAVKSGASAAGSGGPTI